MDSVPRFPLPFCPPLALSLTLSLSLYLWCSVRPSVRPSVSRSLAARVVPSLLFLLVLLLFSSVVDVVAVVAVMCSAVPCPGVEIPALLFSASPSLPLCAGCASLFFFHPPSSPALARLLLFSPSSHCNPKLLLVWNFRQFHEAAALRFYSFSECRGIVFGLCYSPCQIFYLYGPCYPPSTPVW